MYCVIRIATVGGCSGVFHTFWIRTGIRTSGKANPERIFISCEEELFKEFVLAED